MSGATRKRLTLDSADDLARWAREMRNEWERLDALLARTAAALERTVDRLTRLEKERNR